MSADYPVTLILVHPKERRSKCSLEPLRGRKDLRFVNYPGALPRGSDSTSMIRLAIDGPALTRKDGNSVVLLIDGTWRYAKAMNDDYAHVPARSLPGFKTAYPRTSKLFDDPGGGLASVEALFVTYRILGRPTTGLLDHYRWADAFLKLNRFVDR